MNKTPIISARDLQIGYGEQVVLSDIGINLREGQLTCFMGPNGSGKSTLLRTICGLQPPLKGDVCYQGKSISTIRRQDRAFMYSVVLTDRLTSDYMTGRELVATGRLPHTGWHGLLSEEDNQKVDHALEITGTTHLADKWLFRLSDGQRQKLMIARALCQETPIIILDEPTAHLDLNNRVSIVNLLRNLAHEHNRSVLMATHELDLALQLADRLWLAEPGKSVLEGIPEDLVLDGRLDQVFQFKGYDLKSGQVETKKTGREVRLTGSGSLYLWTKNALERNGYEVNQLAELLINVPQSPNNLRWELNNKHYESLEEVIHALTDIFNSRND
ncbi:ABC transporter ATP-binding protein [Fulvivirga sedimenti]|uniref:ABC transporter ATP-binding protein n=1 Tax=Fulvivirga sedimenti TaxID=2879465 RepID=A0A9X1KXE7_9BACT|nr:ABC transporter ATP-binding protein [Fulvivirga sedimenti]MCA6074132.1 ABC transporter ATP-binding protein [Fulvivirga sedimenti]